MKKIVTNIFAVALLMMNAVTASAVDRPTKSLAKGEFSKSEAVLPDLNSRDGMLMRQSGYMGAPFGALNVPSRLVKGVSPQKTASVLPDDFKMYGALISSEPYPGRARGIYGFNANVLDSVMCDATIFNSIYGAVYADDKFWVVTPKIEGNELVGMTYYTLDTKTWKKIGEMSGNIYFSPNGMGYDPVTKEIYVCGAYLEGGYYLGSVDMATGVTYHISDMGEVTYKAIAFTAEGEMYAVQQTKYNEPVRFVKVDKLTGTVLETHDTNLRFSPYMASACIDHNTGKFYYNISAYDPTVSSTMSRVWDIDMQTGNATAVFDVPENASFVGTFVPAAEIADNAPGKVTDLVAMFTDDSLSGTVQFTVPSQLVDGSAGTGTVTYIVKCNGTEVGQGSAAYGEVVTCPVTVDAAGTYIITVVLSNENGKSEVTSLSRYVGAALPSPASDVTLSYESGIMTASWTAAKASGPGYFNPSDVRYTVRLMPDDVVVAESQSELDVEFRKPAPDSLTIYYVEVTAEYKGNVAGTAKSNTVTLGSVVPPYTNPLASAEDVQGFTFEDTNNDGVKWYYSASDKAIVVRYSLDDGVAMNDWAFLPPVKLEEGNAYYFSFEAKAASPNYAERIEAKVGTAASSSAMAVTLLEPTEVTSRDYKEFKMIFTPEATGVYYFGLHGCSLPDKLRLYVTNISVSAPISGPAPAAPTNLTAVRDASGALKATVTFTLPTVDTEGSALESLSKVVIRRNGEPIHTVDNPAPGATLTYTDNLTEDGLVTYTVVAYNLYGAGLTAEASAYVGFAKPAVPLNLTTEFGATDAEAILRWDAVTCDVNGNPFPSGAVKYNVYRVVNGQGVRIATNMADREINDTPYSAAAAQNFVLYAVEAVYGTSLSDMADSPTIPLGKPYALPFKETFNPTSPSYNWALGYSNEGTYWGMIEEYQGVMNQDTKGGMAVMVGQYVDATAMLYGGSINVTAGANTSLSFYYYDYPSANVLDVKVKSGAEWQTVKTITMSGENAARGWKRAVVDMSPYSGKKIQIGFQGKVVDTKWLFIDNVFVGTMPQCNLAIKALNAPASVSSTEKQFTVTTAVYNDGLTDVASGAYAVALYVNNKKVQAADGVAVLGGSEASYSFTVPVNVFSDEELSLYAKIEPVGLSDENADDDMTSPKVVKVLFPEFPVVSGLQGKRAGNGVELEWNAPLIDPNASRIVDDSVEAYTAYSIGMAGSDLENDYIGDWIMVDKDGASTYGIRDALGLPVEYPNAGGRMAFQVFDGESLGLSSWRARTGSQMFVCFAAADVQNDDWMISPELSGNSQTVSFYAKSITLQYGSESMEFYYSMGSTDTDDFVKIGETENAVQAQWSEFKYEVPAGARRFAIRCVSKDRFALCIDDLKFEAKDHTLSSLQIAGYNVYCNGEQMNSELVRGTRFQIEEVPSGLNSFCVTTIYNAGESLPSDNITIDNTSVDGIAMSSLLVEGGNGVIKIVNAQGQHVAVFAVDGRLVVSSDGAERMLLPVSAGVYLVKVGMTATKVIVK